MAGIRIDALPPTNTLDRDDEIPVMFGGHTIKIKVGQILDLFVVGAPAGLDTWLELLTEVASKNPLIHGSTAKTLLVDADEIGGANSATSFAALKVTLANLRDSLAADPWAFQPVGSYVWADDGISGFVAPSKNKSYRYIELTAGLTGVGAYNESVLTGESVSGSAPLVQATAVINLTGSQFNGQTQRLINTEARTLRPAATPGTAQADAVQNMTGVYDFRRLLGGGSILVGSSGVFTFGSAASSDTRLNVDPGGGTLQSDRLNFSLANSSGARTDVETRVKNLGVRAYRRIK
jgi:hypothetical protein